MKKVATPKCKGLKTKTLMKKRGNSKTQRAQNKDLRGKKKGTPKYKGPKIKTSDEKKGNPQMQGD
jgi:hypothetical protein